MNATGSDRETGPESAEGESDHSYFQAIEEAFVRLRGAPLLLSPADWRIAQRWHRDGVPLGLVVSTLEQIFEQRRERAAQGAAVGKVHSLRYCASAVEAAWRSQRELSAAGERQAAPEIDLAARLAALAAAVPADLAAGPAGGRRLGEAIRALSGSPSEVEDALAALEEETLAAAEERLAAGERSEIEAETEAALARLADRPGGGPGGWSGGRLGADEVAAARERLLRRALRRRLGLPVLSLFAPQAARGDENAHND